MLEGGDYTFHAVARQNGTEVYRDSGRFSVEPFRVEYLRTVQDRVLLEKLAARSGGRMIEPDSLEVWANTVDFPARIVFQNREYPLWQRWPMLAVVIALFSIEWLLRKRKGML